MASSREGDALKRFLDWDKPLISTGNTCKKWYETTKIGSQKMSEYKKAMIHKKGQKYLKAEPPEKWQVSKKFYEFGLPG